MRKPTLASSRLARLVAERIAALRGQLVAVAAEAVERATRSVGSAVGEAVRLALRAAAGRGSVPPPAPPDPWRDHRYHHETDDRSPAVGRYDVDPWDEHDRRFDAPASEPGYPTAGHDDRDPWDDSPGGTGEVDPWDDAPDSHDTGSVEDASEPHERRESSPPRVSAPEPRRGWWRRMADRVVGALVPARLTRASVTAAVVAGVVTLFPPATAAIVGAALAALVA
jgi:hypothetical protein